MFIYSFRAGTIKLIGAVCVALTVLITLIAFVPTYTVSSQASANTTEYSYDDVENEQDAARFLSQFGWTVDATPIEVKAVTIPSEFDKVLGAYNELQKEQGLNLAKLKGRDVTRYTFRVTNYPDYSDPVYANVLVYRDRVVAGDVCSADAAGFVHGFERAS